MGGVQVEHKWDKEIKEVKEFKDISLISLISLNSLTTPRSARHTEKDCHEPDGSRNDGG